MNEHIPVLLKEILEHIDASVPVTYLDGTFGRGGHASAIIELNPENKAVGVDCDHEAIEYGQKNYSQFIEEKKLYLVHLNYSDEHLFEEIKKQTGLTGFDLILLDLGVSSPQLDQPHRGFSFYDKGPLDMRMDHRIEIMAKEIVNTFSEDELNELFKKYGEIYSPYRVVRAIVQDREEKPFELTSDLSSLIERVEGWKKKGRHPATKFFMALRLVVNKELEGVESSIPIMIDHLNPGGKLMVITFHSSEDRIVKYIFKGHLEKGRLVNKKVITAKWEDQKKNPRARSAKLRIYQKEERI